MHGIDQQRSSWSHERWCGRFVPCGKNLQSGTICYGRNQWKLVSKMFMFLQFLSFSLLSDSSFHFTNSNCVITDSFFHRLVQVSSWSLDTKILTSGKFEWSPWPKIVPHRCGTNGGMAHSHWTSPFKWNHDSWLCFRTFNRRQVFWSKLCSWILVFWSYHWSTTEWVHFYFYSLLPFFFSHFFATFLRLFFNFVA